MRCYHCPLSWLLPCSGQLQNALWYRMVIFIFYLRNSAVRLGRKTYLIDMATPENRAQLVAVSNTLIGVFLLIIGGASSWLSVWVSYRSCWRLLYYALAAALWLCACHACSHQLKTSFCEVIMKASDLFVRALEAEGVEYVFGIPGEENLDLLESLRESSIKLILTRHEQGPVSWQRPYGRLTGKAGVCLATLGPGATNFVTASGLCPTWRDADADDYRPEAHQDRASRATSRSSMWST